MQTSLRNLLNDARSNSIPPKRKHSIRYTGRTAERTFAGDTLMGSMMMTTPMASARAMTASVYKTTFTGENSMPAAMKHTVDSTDIGRA